MALPCGIELGNAYTLGRVLGQGGFGITYIAIDNSNGRRVAVKEYFPDSMATRTSQRTVTAHTGERGEGFAYGKECFLEEAKTLAAFIGNPGIVRVFRYFEENSTAYFVMEYVEGVSFKDYLRSRGGKISFQEAKQILIPVMDALAVVHSKGIVHRDVSPDNIIITAGGAIKLIDFGAARYSIGDMSRSLDVVLKHGYAPREQYSRHGRQGPFTDVYSLAATFYRAITGVIPQDSIDRIDNDSLVSPRYFCPDLTPQGEFALYKGLAIQPANRFQSTLQFKDCMLSNAPTPPAQFRPAPAQYPQGVNAAQYPQNPQSPPVQAGGAYAGQPAPAQPDKKAKKQKTQQPKPQKQQKQRDFSPWKTVLASFCISSVVFGIILLIIILLSGN